MNKENAYVEKKYLTQQEVAALFRVKPGTVKNWRDAGYLDFFQVAGSSRVLYPADTINQFERAHTKKAKVIDFKRPEPVRIGNGGKDDMLAVQRDHM